MQRSETRGYSLEEAASLLGLPLAQVKGFVQAGVVAPGAAEHEPKLTFQDLVLLRTAKGLGEHRISRRRILRALAKLRAQLPASKPLTGVVIAAEGDEIVVREGASRWDPESGQVLFDFQVDELAAQVAPLRSARAGSDADQWHARGRELELGHPEEARQAFERALALDPDHFAANLDLGRLFHEHGYLANAEFHYRKALTLRPQDPTATFNLAVVLEDQDRFDEAIEAYRKTLALDPGCADACYNLAQLHERRGDKAAAIRHLKDYRRLSGPTPSD